MIKRHFVSQVAAAAKLSSEQVRAVLAATQKVAADELIKTGEVRVPGLVSLKVMERGERCARNPKTGQEYMIAPGHTVKSRPVSGFALKVTSNFQS
jgi:nucleoid DNA-binding protein